MAKTVKQLIIASGNSGAAGQSFRNHVTGAVTGAAASEYSVTGWTWYNHPANPGGYAHGTVRRMTVDFTQGSRAFNIKRLGDAISVQRTSWTNGANVSKVSSVVGGATGSYVDLTFLGGVINTATFGASVWFTGYVDPNTPAGGNPEYITFSANIQNAHGGGTSGDLTFTLGYQVDIGDFSPYLSEAGISTTVLTRAETAADYEFEWHGNATYTDLQGASQGHQVLSSPGALTERWMRYRVIGAAGWTNYGYISFYDPR